MTTPARYVVNQWKVFGAVSACIALCAYPFLGQKPLEQPQEQHPAKKSTRQERIDWMKSDAMPPK
jgi:hypothetical protein